MLQKQNCQPPVPKKYHVDVAASAYLISIDGKNLFELVSLAKANSCTPSIEVGWKMGIKIGCAG